MAKIIVALDASDCLSAAPGVMPWPKKASDFAWFRECTLNSTVIMGGRTYRSMPQLDKRRVLVVSSQPQQELFAEVCPSFEAALNRAPHDVWIAGGAQIYRQAIETEHVTDLVITRMSGYVKVPNHASLYFSSYKKDFRFDSYILHDKFVIERWVRI